LDWLLGTWSKPTFNDALWKLGVRARRAINISGARTPEEITKYGNSRFIKINGCGITTLNEIREWLFKYYGLKMKDDDLSDQEILKRYDWEKINGL
jgi:hypothetical protein